MTKSNTRKGGRPRIDSKSVKDEFLRTYESLNARLITTCRALKIAPNTIRNWRKQVVFSKDGVEIVNEFAKAMTEIEELIAENVEGSLIDNALDPHGAPVSKIFYLKNNMREKYGENNVLEVTPSKLWFENKEIKQLEE